MSWSVSFNNLNVQELADLEVLDGNLQGGLPEARAQFENARRMVMALIGTEALGTRHGHFNGNMSGHANPNHENVEGWSKDTISMSVSRV